MICDGCSHNSRRGGAILCAADTCLAAESHGFDEAQAVFLGDVLMDLAQRNGKCVHRLPYPDYPDAYRSKDLHET